MAANSAAQRMPVAPFGQFAYCQLVDDDGGGERPVSRPGGVPHRVGEPAVALMPPGRPLMEDGHPLRMLEPQLQAQHLGEQGVVAVPARGQRLDERVRAGQGRQDSGGVLVAGQLDGDIGADMLQDARAQQDLANLRRLHVEHLVDQVADQGAVLGQQFLDELAGSG